MKCVATCCSAIVLVDFVSLSSRKIASTSGVASSATFGAAAGSAPDSCVGRVCRLQPCRNSKPDGQVKVP